MEGKAGLQLGIPQGKLRFPGANAEGAVTMHRSEGRGELIVRSSWPGVSAGLTTDSQHSWSGWPSRGVGELGRRGAGAGRGVGPTRLGLGWESTTLRAGITEAAAWRSQAHRGRPLLLRTGTEAGKHEGRNLSLPASHPCQVACVLQAQWEAGPQESPNDAGQRGGRRGQASSEGPTSRLVVMSRQVREGAGAVIRTRHVHTHVSTCSWS